MDRSLIVLLAVQAAAFWPVWRWLAGRVANDTEAGGMLVALLAAVLLPSRRAAPPQSSLTTPAMVTLMYAATFHAVPSLVRALFALAALAATWNAAREDESAAARWGLFLLAAPMVPTLQFYLGYPLRLTVAHLGAAWLRLGGFPVSVDGVGLAWQDRIVLVDAPCSGVRMIWGALFLSLATAVLRHFRARRTLILVAAGLGATLLANSLRAASLFFTETGILDVPSAHDGVGVVAFAATGIAIAAVSQRIARPS